MSSLKTLTQSSKPCIYCSLTIVNEFKYGPLYERDGIVAHYYCVLFSNNLCQNGTDEEGIKGFLIKDILRELKKIKSSKCHYCHKSNASIQCARRICKVSFHYPCGIMHGSMHQFQYQFKSYCPMHRLYQPIPEKVMAEAEAREPDCVICFEPVTCRSAIDAIWAKCCGKTWYHRDCLQRHALNTGYFFKCAICGNRKEFKKWVVKYGIFVPKQDASWELDPNAFVELYRQHGRCDAAVCKCPNGREFDDEMPLGNWQLVLCYSCGSQGIHVGCGLLSRHKPSWECRGCHKVGSSVKSRRKCSRSDRSSRESDENGESASSKSETSEFDRAAGSRGESAKRVKRKGIDLDESEKLYQKKMKKRKRKKRRTEETSVDLDQGISEGIEQTAEATAATTTAASEPVDPSPDEFDFNEGASGKIKQTAEAAAAAPDPANLSKDESDFNKESITQHTSRLPESSSTASLPCSASSPSSRLADDDINSIVEVYRNIQMTDVRYRVKKRCNVYVISDEESTSDGDDVEVVYERMAKPPGDRCYSVSVSVVMKDDDEECVGNWVENVKSSRERSKSSRKPATYTENIKQMEAELTRLLWRRRKNARSAATDESTSSGSSHSEVINLTSDDDSGDYFSAESGEIIDVE